MEERRALSEGLEVPRVSENSLGRLRGMERGGEIRRAQSVPRTRKQSWVFDGAPAWGGGKKGVPKKKKSQGD